MYVYWTESLCSCIKLLFVTAVNLYGKFYHYVANMLFKWPLNLLYIVLVEGAVIIDQIQDSE